VQGCERSEGLQGHHPTYKKPLLVVWLCRAHHEAVHHGGPLLLKPGGPRKVAKAPKKPIAAPQQLKLAA
jgi:hypothetical protein